MYYYGEEFARLISWASFLIPSVFFFWVLPLFLPQPRISDLSRAVRKYFLVRAVQCGDVTRDLLRDETNIGVYESIRHVGRGAVLLVIRGRRFWEVKEIAFLELGEMPGENVNKPRLSSHPKLSTGCLSELQ